MVRLFFRRGLKGQRKLLQSAVFTLEKVASNHGGTNANHNTETDVQDALNCLQILSVMKPTRKLLIDSTVIPSIVHLLSSDITAVRGGTVGSRTRARMVTSLSVLNNLVHDNLGFKQQVLNQNGLDVIMELISITLDSELLEASARVLNAMSNTKDQKVLDALSKLEIMPKLLSLLAKLENPAEKEHIQPYRKLSGLDNTVEAMFYQLSHLQQDTSKVDSEEMKEKVVRYYLDSYIVNGSLKEQELGLQKLLQLSQSKGNTGVIIENNGVETLVNNVLTKGSTMESKQIAVKTLENLVSKESDIDLYQKVLALGNVTSFDEFLNKKYLKGVKRQKRVREPSPPTQIEVEVDV